MATATATATAMGDGDSNGDGVGNGNGDGNSNRNGNGHGNGNNDKGRIASSCAGDVQCCGRGDTLPPPPWTQRSVHSPVLHHGGDAAKSVCSLSRRRVPDSSPWIVFYFLQVLFSLLNNPLFFPRIIQVLKNPVSLLTLYLFPSHFIFLQRLAWAGLRLCACNMPLCGRGDATATRSPNHPPPDAKKSALPSAEPWEVPLQRAVSPFSGGEILTAQDGLACLFFSTISSVY